VSAETSPPSQSSVQDLIEEGRRLRAQSRADQALAVFARTVEREPHSVEALAGLAWAHGTLRQFKPAIEAARRALVHDPANSDALFCLATNLTYVDGFAEAEAVAERLVSAAPDDAAALVTAGKIALARGRRDLGMAHFARAKAIAGAFKPLFVTIAQIVAEYGKPEDGRAALDELLEKWPDDDAVLFAVAQRRMLACDWRNFDDLTRRLTGALDRVVAGGRVDPDMLWTLSHHGFGYADTMKVARRIASDAASRVPPEERSRPRRRAGRAKIRVAFLQAMTTFHSTQVAIRNLVERIDRGRFEVIGYARHDREQAGSFQGGFRGAFDRFLDLTPLSDLEASRTIARDDIDVLLDMQGLNALNNLGVLAYRPARVQALYYGFGHGTGGSIYDYYVTDRAYMPQRLAALSGDAHVYLPGCHMAPTLGDVAPGQARRADQGLPPDAFVFCCFNNPWKFEPLSFSLWMRLLRRIPGSVLWLVEWRKDAVANLRQEAARSGIEPARLIFAEIAPHAEHLRRLQLADLAINGALVGGGVTSFDALWAGVPMVAIEGAGDVLWSRLGAVMLRVAGLDELVFDSYEGLERGVMALARAPERLAAIRAKVAAVRVGNPLFDIDLAARKLEAACKAMTERSEGGSAPRNIDIERLDA
jgi:predicted O-linked N-acetylglucosamine transferase (SPINDLY family)